MNSRLQLANTSLLTTTSILHYPYHLGLFNVRSNGMKAPMTREKYRGRLAKFFDFIGLKVGTIEERSKSFTERGKKEPDWVFVSVLRFAQAQKDRVENGAYTEPRMII